MPSGSVSTPASQGLHSSQSSRSGTTGRSDTPPIPHLRGGGGRDVPLGNMLWFSAGGIGPSPSLNRLGEVVKRENDRRRWAKQRNEQQMAELQAEEKRKRKEKKAGEVGLFSLLLRPTVKKVVLEKVVEKKVEVTKKKASDVKETKVKEDDKTETVEKGKEEEKEGKKDENAEKPKEEAPAPEMSGANGP